MNKAAMRSTGGIAAGLTALTLAFVLPAHAGTRSSDTDVSCDPSIIKAGISVPQTSTGNFSIKQTAATESSSTRTYATSANGKDLPTKTVATGGTASWTGVVGSTYTVKAYRSGEKNCNSALPGDGNYHWSYSVTSTG